MNYLIYDGISDINWFKSGVKTADEMKKQPELTQLFTKTSVLFMENDEAFDWRVLDGMATSVNYQLTGDNEYDLKKIVDLLNAPKPTLLSLQEQLNALTSAFEVSEIANV